MDGKKSSRARDDDRERRAIERESVYESENVERKLMKSSSHAPSTESADGPRTNGGVNARHRVAAARMCRRRTIAHVGERRAKACATATARNARRRYRRRWPLRAPPPPKGTWRAKKRRRRRSVARSHTHTHTSPSARAHKLATE
uniref:Uncharacterized protein n=1 Tax=Sipha flava TaxID=143950 RepID=A0A2S2QVU8_9HEMI